MTKKQHQRQQGFTLIEMIAVLILVGMMSAVAGLGIVKYVQGYLFAKDNAAISANAQLAIARISRDSAPDDVLACFAGMLQHGR